MEEGAGASRRRPFLRAASEFVVIVVGVLVALALENWAGDRADRAAELDYLLALVDDVRTDSMIWTDIHVPNFARYREILEATIPVAYGDLPIPPDTASFLRDVSGSYGRPLIIAEGPTYEELLATGSLRLIQSGEVRSAVVDYYQSKRVAQLRSESGSTELQDLIEAVLPRDMGRSYIFLGGSPGGEDLLGRVFREDTALEAIVSTEAARAMGQQLNYVARISTTVEGLLEEAAELIQRLDQEIEGLR